eukprot:2276846-Lingulodinium_polyedra.AAC.1
MTDLRTVLALPNASTWPPLDAHGRYPGPLQRSCRHRHSLHLAQGAGLGGDFATGATAAYPA